MPRTGEMLVGLATAPGRIFTPKIRDNYFFSAIRELWPYHAELPRAAISQGDATWNLIIKYHELLTLMSGDASKHYQIN